MDPMVSLFILLLILLLTPLTSASSSLDPEQLSALKSLGISTSKDPCLSPSACDTSKPYHHLLSLTLSSCSPSISLSSSSLKSLSTLQSLSFSDCPISPIPISATGPSIILSDLKSLTSRSITHANLTGTLPKTWHQRNITNIDLSGNTLKGHIPDSIAHLILLKNISLSSNSLTGSIPDSLSSALSLSHLDLSSNHFNGTVPRFLAQMNGLKYLNLEGNNFQGVMPFNASFINRLTVFKIGENGNLCYNKTEISSKVKLGIAPCDNNGLPMSPPAKSPQSGNDSDYDYDDDSSDKLTSQKSSGGSHGPNKVVLGIAIAFASIIFLIIFLIFLSKRCV